MCILSFHTMGGSDVESIGGEEGESVFLPDSDEVSRRGYVFLGWAEDTGAVTKDYDGGDRYTLNGDATLYAVWKRISEDDIEVSLSAATDRIVYEPGDTIILTVEVDLSDHFYLKTPQGSFTILRQDGVTMYHDGTFVERNSPSAAYPEHRYRNGQAYEVEVYVDDDCEDGIYTFELKATDGILNSAGDGSVEGTVTSMVDYSLDVRIKEGGEDILVNVSPSKLTLHVDDRYRLSASVSPSAYKEDVVWSSSNPDVVRVSSSGRLTAVSVGRANVTATVDGISDTCTIVVEECIYDQKIIDPDYLKAEATCNTHALYYYSCECGYHGSAAFEDTSTEYAAHKFGEWFTELYPTEELTGLLMRVCAVCGEEETKDIPALGYEHSYLEEITPPSCNRQGYTIHTCVICGDSYEDSYVDALGHQYGEWHIIKESNVCIAGEERQDCERCGYFKTRKTLTLPHIYEEVVTLPTCTKQGYSTHICVICGDSYVDSYVNALEHQFGEWFIERQPTEEVSGLRKRTCTHCNYEETEDVPALEHKHSYIVVIVPATCEEQGKLTYVCETCGHTYLGGTIEPLGHNYVDGKCNNCGEVDPFTPVHPTIVFGDVNSDAVVNNIDAMLVLQYAVGLLDESRIDLAASDVNGDFSINNIDAMLILQYAVGLIDQFPAMK